MGWSQQELKTRTGIGASRLSAIENGHSAPNVSELLRLREALGLGLDELLTGEPSDAVLRDPSLINGLRRIEALAGLPGLRTVARLLEAIASLVEELRAEESAVAAPKGRHGR